MALAGLLVVALSPLSPSPKKATPETPPSGKGKPPAPTSNTSRPEEASRGKTWSVNLKEALDLAMTRNFDFRAKKMALVQFEQDQKLLGTQMYPQVEVLSFASALYEARGDAVAVQKDWGKWGPYFIGELRVIQPLYTFGAFDKAKEAMDHLYTVKKAEQKQTLNQILYATKKAYYQVLLTRKLDKVANDTEKILNQVLDKAREMYRSEGGKVKEHEMIQLELFELEFKKIRGQLDIQKRLASKNLKLILGLHPDDKINIKDSRFPRQPIELAGLEDMLKLTLKHRPEYRQIRSGLKALAAKREALEKSNYPQIFVAGFVKGAWSSVRDYSPNPYVYNPYTNAEGGLALGARWRLEFFQNKAKIKAAEAEAKALTEQKKKASLGIPLLVEKAWLEAGHAANVMRMNAVGYRKAAIWLDNVKTGFELGNNSARELVEGFYALTQARQKLYQGRFDYQMALAELVRQVGDNTATAGRGE